MCAKHFEELVLFLVQRDLIKGNTGMSSGPCLSVPGQALEKASPERRSNRCSVKSTVHVRREKICHGVLSVEFFLLGDEVSHLGVFDEACR